VDVNNPAHRSESEANGQRVDKQSPRDEEQRHGIDAARIAPTDEEAARINWALWDGLSDERGPIPAFGPVRTDENGRLVMSDAEQAARRDAAIRTLAAIAKITDETDTDEVWDEVFRGLERDS
jgi:hypothetical protein